MRPTTLHRRSLLLLAVFASAVVYFQIKIYNPRLAVAQIYNMVNPQESIYCYDVKAETLPDISEVKPRKGKSIFFHETSCKSHAAGKIVITSRQACAVESAARMNPRLDVYLLYSSPGTFRYDDTESDHFLQALRSYENVKIMHVDFKNYTRNTPIEDLYESGTLEYSYYPRIHASDIVRFLTLWKYGGTYLDLDVIVLQTFENLNPNFAGSESDANVAVGVMNFGHNGIGHYHVKTCLNDLRNNFRGSDWGYNGPGVITRMAKHICGVEKAKDMPRRDCEGFTVYPPEAFYAIPWWNWTMFFDEGSAKRVIEMTKSSYVVHVWNKHSGKTPVPKDSNMAYAFFARKFCPKVFDVCETVF